MLKPSDVPYISALPYTQEHINALIDKFDAALEVAARTKWPAMPRVDDRDGSPQEALDEVVRRYRAAGWIVRTNSILGTVKIDHPESTTGAGLTLSSPERKGWK